MEDNMRVRLTKVGNSILTATRNELYLSMRFLDIALSSLEYQIYLSTISIGTDGEKILYHPKYLMDLYSGDRIAVNRAYLHMVLHCMFRHMFTREDREEELWNLSCDIAVESMIDGMDYKAINQVSSDIRTEMYELLSNELKVLTAEGIYRELKKRLIPILEMELYKREFCVDDHGIWEAMKTEQGEEPSKESQEESKENQEESEEAQQDRQKEKQDSDQNNQQEVNETSSGVQPQSLSKEQEELNQRWQEITEKIETNLETIGKEYGEEAGEFLARIKVETRKRYDYDAFLRKFAVMREEIQVDPDSFDYIFYTYGMQLYDNIPLIEPLEYKEVNRIEEFVVAIDTSGSCSGQLIKTFLEQTYAILKDANTFAKKVNIHIIQCDAQIQEVYQVTCEEDLQQYMENFTVKGFGGTDFRPVFQYVDQLIETNQLNQLKGMLYFTDGYGIYPKRRPNYDVAFVFLRDDYSDTQVPAWAIKIQLEEEELRRKR